MRLLTDENIETEWLHALRDDGHDIERVVDVESLGVSASDSDVLSVAAKTERVLLTADQSDFSDPPRSDHAGVIIITDVQTKGATVRRAIRRIELAGLDLSGRVAYLSDWS